MDPTIANVIINTFLICSVRCSSKLNKDKFQYSFTTLQYKRYLASRCAEHSIHF